MSIDIDAIIKAMASSAVKAIDASPEIKKSITQAIESRKESIAELAAARANGNLSPEEFEVEMEREKAVLECELVGLEIPLKSSIQRAIHAAIEALTNSLSQASK